MTGPGDVPLMDTSNIDAQAWWASVPLRGDDGRGNWRGKPVTSIIDGVLADSAGYEAYAYPNVSTARLEKLGGMDKPPPPKKKKARRKKTALESLDDDRNRYTRRDMKAREKANKSTKVRGAKRPQF